MSGKKKVPPHKKGALEERAKRKRILKGWNCPGRT